MTLLAKKINLQTTGRVGIYDILVLCIWHVIISLLTYLRQLHSLANLPTSGKIRCTLNFAPSSFLYQGVICTNCGQVTQGLTGGKGKVTLLWDGLDKRRIDILLVLLCCLWWKENHTLLGIFLGTSCRHHQGSACMRFPVFHLSDDDAVDCHDHFSWITCNPLLQSKIISSRK